MDAEDEHRNRRCNRFGRYARIWLQAILRGVWTSSNQLHCRVDGGEVVAKIRMRDIVIVLPGFTGSVLQKAGVDVWEASGQAIWSGLTRLGRPIQELRIDVDDDPEAEELG